MTNLLCCGKPLALYQSECQLTGGHLGAPRRRVKHRPRDVSVIFPEARAAAGRRRPGAGSAALRLYGLHVEIVAPGDDLAVLQFEDAHDFGRDLLAVLERETVDPLVEDGTPAVSAWFRTSNTTSSAEPAKGAMNLRISSTPFIAGIGML